MRPEKAELTPEVRSALRRYSEMTFGDLSDTERLAEYCYNAGFREAVSAMVVFQDLPGQIARVERKMHDLGELLKRHGLTTDLQAEQAATYEEISPKLAATYTRIYGSESEGTMYDLPKSAS